MMGLKIVQIPSDPRGNVDLKALKEQCDDTVLGMMLTNPNTLGLFDEHIEEVCKIIHDCGGLMYGDGANLNTLLGVLRPADIGFDLMHFNLHKTFAVPHGGGGPGSGPVEVAAHLADFLPEPLVGILEEGDDETPPLFGFIRPAQIHRTHESLPRTIRRRIRSSIYIHRHARPGWFEGYFAVRGVERELFAARFRDTYHVPFDRICMHEFVAEGQLKVRMCARWILPSG